MICKCLILWFRNKKNCKRRLEFYHLQSTIIKEEKNPFLYDDVKGKKKYKGIKAFSHDKCMTIHLL